MNSWRSRTTVRATPERVIDALTDTDACARWSPIPFSLDDPENTRLQAGTTTRVSGRMLGARVRFRLETLAADPTRLQLHARGPIEILVHYTLKPARAGCAVEAVISVRSPETRIGRLLARASGLLLTTGILDHALRQIAREAERTPPTRPPNATHGRAQPARACHARASA